MENSSRHGGGEKTRPDMLKWTHSNFTVFALGEKNSSSEAGHPSQPIEDEAHGHWGEERARIENVIDIVTQVVVNGHPHPKCYECEGD